jgi:hypothetical protein
LPCNVIAARDALPWRARARRKKKRKPKSVAGRKLRLSASFPIFWASFAGGLCGLPGASNAYFLRDVSLFLDFVISFFPYFLIS